MKEEILQKEEEKHQLVKTGVVTDWQKSVRRAVQSYPDGDAGGFDKRAFLAHFYHTIQYSRFIFRERGRSEALKKHWRGKAASFLSVLQTEKPAPLDREMKVTPPLTVGYCLSDTIYHTIYAQFSRAAQIFNQPDEVHSFFARALRETYPLYMDAYMEALKKDDASLWNSTCLYLKELSSKVTNYALANTDRAGYQDIVRDHTWSSAYELLRKRFVEQTGNIPVFHTGADFRNYIIKSCHYLIDNAYKKYAGKECYVEDTTMLFDEEDDSGSIRLETVVPALYADEEDCQPVDSLDAGVKELEIDVNNAYEVAYAVSIILLNTSHPLYRRLTEGIEDKVSLLLDKAVQGLSYNEIVEERYGALETGAFQRAVVKARKDYERVRKTLTGKLIELVEEKNKVPFLSHRGKLADVQIKKQLQ
ncbi:MAG: hypothetical protein LBN71_08755 [Tannerella sp.]|jgi:hypothetical protein|nr:hypothetical protein [Tannerella sp.]